MKKWIGILILAAGVASAGNYYSGTDSIALTNTAGWAKTNSGLVRYPVSVTFVAPTTITGGVAVSVIDSSGVSNILFRVNLTNVTRGAGGPDWIFPIRKTDILRVDDNVTNQINIRLNSEYYP